MAFGLKRKTPENPQFTHPKDVMVQALNWQPVGTRMNFIINFGPKLKERAVTAYFDPIRFRESGGTYTELRIDGLSEEMKSFLQR